MKNLIETYGETLYKWCLMVLLMIILTTLIYGCATPSYTTHERLQEEMTFDKRLKENEAFTVKSYRSSINTLQAKLKELEKKKGETSKKAQMQAELAELRKQIAELENR